MYNRICILLSIHLYFSIISLISHFLIKRDFLNLKYDYIFRLHNWYFSDRISNRNKTVIYIGNAHPRMITNNTVAHYQKEDIFMPKTKFEDAIYTIIHGYHYGLRNDRIQCSPEYRWCIRSDLSAGYP